MIIEAINEYVYDKRFLYQALVSLSTYCIIRLGLASRSRYKRYQLFKYYGIPGPESNILNGSAWVFNNSNERHMVYQRMCEKYGKTYGLFLYDEPILITKDLDILKKVFFDETQSFTERGKLVIETLFSDGILFAKYHRWRIMRKILSPPFSKHNMRKGMNIEPINDIIKQMNEYIESKLDLIDNQPDIDPTFDIRSLMKSVGLNVISLLALKLPDLQVMENQSHTLLLDELLSNSNTPIVTALKTFPFLVTFSKPLTYLVGFNELISEITKVLNRVLDEGLEKLKIESRNQDDNGRIRDEDLQLIDSLIKLVHDDKLSRREVLSNALVILVAGYETTAQTLSYLFWVLGKDPDLQEKLRQEITAYGYDCEFITQVINETMRLYPTVMSFTTRTATRTIKINELVIPQGTKVVNHVWLTHRDPELWENPDKFDPNRFSAINEIHPCAFAPFGLGDRKCLGYNFAMLEMKMLISSVLTRYRIHLVSPKEMELRTCAVDLSDSHEKIKITLERIRG